MGCVSYDDKELFFASDRNLWVARFNEPGDAEAGFHDPKPLETLNTPAEALPPSISGDGTMLFFSNRPEDLPGGLPPRPGGQGKSDLWVALRCKFADGDFGAWQMPSNLESLNSPRYEICPRMSADGSALLYATGPSSFSLTLTKAPLVPQFRRGDPDDSGVGNITDAVGVLNYLFAGGEPPKCLDAADIDNDGVLNITDPVSHLNFLFGGGAPPASPGPDVCGPDPHAPGVPGNLGCAEYTSC